MPVQSSGWSHFPEVMLDKLRSVYGHPLVVWELLDSDEGLDDLMDSVGFSDPDVEAACRASLKKLRARATGVKRVAHHLEAQQVLRPRLPRTGDELEQMQACFLDMVSSSGTVLRRRRNSQLGISLQAAQEDPEVLEQKERARWQAVLAEFIRGAGLPVLQLVQSSEHEPQVWSRIFGNRRAKTLRNRARAWRVFHLWISLAKGYCWPRTVLEVADYLELRISEGCGASVPRDLMSALALLETVGRVSIPECLSKDATLNSIVRSMTEDLERGAAPKRPAKLCTVAMLISMEICVCNTSMAPFLRILAWTGLLMHWCTLRTDDVQWLDVGRLVFTDNGLSMVLRRSKTTGPGKKAREVPVYVARTLSLSGKDWLGVGLEVFWMPEFFWERSYFLASPARDYLSCNHKFLSPEQLSAHLRGMYTHLACPKFDGSVWVSSDRFLIPGELQVFWSGHSARHWLPSWATALSKSDRDFLGRWQAGARQSTEYVVKAREVVFRVQKLVNGALCQGHESVSELELFEDLKRFCMDRGIPPVTGLAGHQIWRRNSEGHSALLTKFPLFVTSMAMNDEAEAAAEVSADLDTEVEKGKYWYSVSRRTGFRRLHLVNGCGVLPWTVHEAVFVSSVDEAGADAWCKTCRKRVSEVVAQESSSSGSSSSTESELPEEAGDPSLTGPC